MLMYTSSISPLTTIYEGVFRPNPAKQQCTTKVIKKIKYDRILILLAFLFEEYLHPKEGNNVTMEANIQPTPYTTSFSCPFPILNTRYPKRHPIARVINRKKKLIFISSKYFDIPIKQSLSRQTIHRIESLTDLFF